MALEYNLVWLKFYCNVVEVFGCKAKENELAVDYYHEKSFMSAGLRDEVRS